MKTLPLLSGMAACLIFGGCYTQLYTQGQFARAENDPYARSGIPEGDTLTEQSGTVIVNNYYRESPYYRGYAISDWDYPAVRFGFYHSGYRDYYGPYWWNDPWYHHRRSHRYDYDRPSTGGGSGGGGSGPYHSDKRLFSDPVPGPRKGRRAPEPETYAPPAAKASQSEPVQAAPASSQSGDSPESSPPNAKPALKKGRRR